METGFCRNCGAVLQPGQAACSNCGAMVSSEAAPGDAPMGYPPPTAAPIPIAAQPPRPVFTAESAPQKGSRYAVVGTWGFVGYAIVMALPIVGFIMAIVWAVSGSGSLNRRNYARATLVFWAATIILSIVFSVFFWSAISQSVNFNYSF